MPTPSLGRSTGTVRSFDPDRGLGEVVDVDGRVLPFHCTEIADGSRSIPIGATVAFEVVAGRQGRWEAADLHPVG